MSWGETILKISNTEPAPRTLLIAILRRQRIAANACHLTNPKTQQARCRRLVGRTDRLDGEIGEISTLSLSCTDFVSHRPTSLAVRLCRRKTTVTRGSRCTLSLSLSLSGILLATCRKQRTRRDGTGRDRQSGGSGGPYPIFYFFPLYSASYSLSSTRGNVDVLNRASLPDRSGLAA